MTAADHALQALLWSEGHDPDIEVSTDLRERVTRDWDSFRVKAEAMGFDAVEHRAMMINREEGDEWAYAAHDFILTRNHHGAGFWDGDWHEPWGSRLTELSHQFGEISTYLNTDRTPCVMEM
jgi:hypothetical protein